MEDGKKNLKIFVDTPLGTIKIIVPASEVTLNFFPTEMLIEQKESWRGIKEITIGKIREKNPGLFC